MSFLVRIIFSLCIFAGMASGMIHTASHESHDACAHEHHDHGNQRDSHDHDKPGSVPHHHACCHLPNADRATDSLSLRIGFQCVLVEIAADRSLIPDEPVFAMDKPPLI